MIRLEKFTSANYPTLISRLKIQSRIKCFRLEYRRNKCYEKVGFVINHNKKIERKIKGEIWTALNMTLDKSQWQKLKSEKNT